MKRHNLPMIFLCGLLLFAGAPQAHGSEKLAPEIKDIIVTTSETDLLLFATVRNAFTEEMLEDVKKGVPAVFTYHMELVKANKTWFDSNLVKSTVTHTMSFNAKSQKYEISFSDPKKEKIVTADLKEAQKAMSEITGVKVIDLDELVPDAPYAIHFKVTLKKGLLPLGLNRILPISSLWNFETDWRTIEFRY